MLTAVSEDKVQVEAISAPEGPSYSCPECGAPVTLCKGPVRIAHFKHKIDKGCKFGQGESEEHRRAKLQIWQALKVHPSVRRCEIEKAIILKDPPGHVRPDVRAVFSRGKPGSEINTFVAIEVQRSKLTIEDISRRTSAYHKQKVAVLWLLLWTAFMKNMKKRTDGKYRSNELDRWLHAAYLGRVYLWKDGESVQPVHFEISQNDLGRSHRALRNVRLGKEVLISDLVKKTLKESKVGEHQVPERTIFMDTLGPWWKGA